MHLFVSEVIVFDNGNVAANPAMLTFCGALCMSSLKLRLIRLNGSGNLTARGLASTFDCDNMGNSDLHRPLSGPG